MSSNLICPPNAAQRSRPYVGPIDIEYVTVNFPNAGQAGPVDRDVLVQFQRPWSYFWVASLQEVALGVNMYLHFVPLGLPANTGVANHIPMAGTERWIPLNNASISNTTDTSPLGRWVRCRVPVKQLFIDADHGFGVVGGGFFATFGGANDVEAVLHGLG